MKTYLWHNIYFVMAPFMRGYRFHLTKDYLPFPIMTFMVIFDLSAKTNLSLDHKRESKVPTSQMLYAPQKLVRGFNV